MTPVEKVAYLESLIQDTIADEVLIKDKTLWTYKKAFEWINEQINLKKEETMKPKIGGIYTLNCDIRMDPQDSDSECYGKKGYTVKVSSFGSGVCLVANEGCYDPEYYVRYDQLDLKDPQKETMKECTLQECTLQEAMDLYKKNGGKFTKKGSPEFPWVVILPNGYAVSKDEGKRIELNYDLFEATWIYEPPTRSAFQAWNESTDTGITDANSMKLGWNAAIDEVLKIITTYDPCLQKQGIPPLLHDLFIKLKED